MPRVKFDIPLPKIDLRMYVDNDKEYKITVVMGDRKHKIIVLNVKEVTQEEFDLYRIEPRVETDFLSGIYKIGGNFYDRWGVRIKKKEAWQTADSYFDYIIDIT